MQQDYGLQSFIQLIATSASTNPSSQSRLASIQYDDLQNLKHQTGAASKIDSASSQLSPPKSDSSPANQEMSTEWRFSGILAVRKFES